MAGAHWIYGARRADSRRCGGAPANHPESRCEGDITTWLRLIWPIPRAAKSLFSSSSKQSCATFHGGEERERGSERRRDGLKRLNRLVSCLASPMLSWPPSLIRFSSFLKSKQGASVKFALFVRCCTLWIIYYNLYVKNIYDIITGN